MYFGFSDLMHVFFFFFGNRVLLARAHVFCFCFFLWSLTGDVKTGEPATEQQPHFNSARTLLCALTVEQHHGCSNGHAASTTVIVLVFLLLQHQFSCFQTACPC